MRHAHADIRDGQLTIPGGARIGPGALKLILPDGLTLASFALLPEHIERGLCLPDGGRQHGSVVYLWSHSGILREVEVLGPATAAGAGTAGKTATGGPGTRQGGSGARSGQQ